MDINYPELEKLFLKYYQVIEEYVEEVNWGYVTIVVFLALLVFYTVDSLKGSQISPGFLLIVLFILFVLGYIVISMFSGIG